MAACHEQPVPSWAASPRNASRSPPPPNWTALARRSGVIRSLALVVLTFSAGLTTTLFFPGWSRHRGNGTFESWSLATDGTSGPLTRPALGLFRRPNDSARVKLAAVSQGEKSDSAFDVPKVESCGQCLLCHRDKPREPTKPGNFPRTFQRYDVLPVKSDEIWRGIAANESLAMYRRENRLSDTNCTECYGCQHELLPMETEDRIQNGEDFNARGGTRAWVFRVEKGPMAERAPNGVALVKVWCLPMKKPLDRDFKPCNLPLANEYARNMLAVDRLVEDCGFGTVTIRAWQGRVDAAVPGAGTIVDWDGMWVTPADGDPLDSQIRSMRAHRLRKLNGTEVLLAAMLDLLTGQNDRHPGNVFVTESGKLTLIDNERAFDESGWTNSVFLPTTHYHAVVHVGKLNMATREHHLTNPDVNALLDYRCYAPGGMIGKSYPPMLSQCLKDISQASHEDIVAKYHVPSNKSTEVLRQRAADMLHQGFEWTLDNTNKRDKDRFPWYPTCCKFDEKRRCLDDWSIVEYLR